MIIVIGQGTDAIERAGGAGAVRAGGAGRVPARARAEVRPPTLLLLLLLVWTTSD